jgi:predicted protein tyrosine phosphatase
MPEFIVSSKSGVKKAVKQIQATHVLSTLDVGDRLYRPHSIPAPNHLQLWFDDEEDPTKHYAPQLYHAQTILTWGSQLPSDAAVVVHCLAGQCRSTAVGLALFLQANGVHEFSAARSWLLGHRPTACPNLLLAAHFDQLLGLNGGFVNLCADIGADSVARWWKQNVPD